MFKATMRPRFSETDALGHVNNTVVPIWFEEARTPFFKFFTPDLDVNSWKLILAKTEIEFLAEIFYGEDVNIESSIDKVGNSSFVVYQALYQNETLAAKGRATLVNFSYKEKKSKPIEETVRTLLLSHKT